ncbi:GIN domain-containing protein [Legionella worsleiensis]|uniref:Putative auto-transporter adhesin head GIN domain-containing protein n=1 Tax=Legionella worsleiensis TaxID=45076 RepID=A0A0W1AEX9_9GAMM|nr:DUF2807 domain-containing protein [Legionella worsleiensis]KTD79828.1 hypothetical protein Lwor_1342 [Legionella worsleiensis]STY32339.1 Protein of uncharacterised function (DUF2807) [Legionella worsleiensis]
MLKRCYSLILLVFFVAGCAHNQQKPSVPMTHQPSSKVTQNRPVSAFNQVDVQGQINVNLHTGYKKPAVVLIGDPRDLAQVSVTVSQGTLFVALGKGFPRFGAVQADIRSKFLNSIRYKGAGSVRGSRLHTSYLNASIENPGTTRLAGSIGLQRLEVTGSGSTQIDGISSRNLQIDLKGNPKVQLTGFANLAKLNIDGDAWLSMYWIKSKDLTIRAKHGAKIQLAGIVNKLDVELWGVAQFKGRYLRAQRSFVKTHDKAMAEISAVRHQSDLAKDASDIYYFNLPTTRADFMAFNGSVLDMRPWSESDWKDYNQYNKQFP